MKWTFNNERPIYVQLVEQLKIKILSGEYKLGQKFPSVRELASVTNVNPNTMQRALSELETQGFLKAERTLGRFVTEDHNLIERERKKLANNKVNDYLSGMILLGYNKNDAISFLKKEGEK